MNKKLKIALIFLLEITIDAIVIFGIFFLIKTYVISPFEIYGPSMCNTFNYIDGKCNSGYGEYIIINKLGKINRGDIVVFHPPHEQEYYIKRVIGMPNDTILIKNGEIFLKDENKEYKFVEPYLSRENRGNTTTFGIKRTEFKVPENSYFLVGDNRLMSTDGRTCFKDPSSNGCSNPNNAFVPEENIQGRAWVALWPINKMQIVPRIGNYDFKEM
ncbi:MAG: signal peptidase I [Candidatus Gracilibacteria bacterium]